MALVFRIGLLAVSIGLAGCKGASDANGESSTEVPAYRDMARQFQLQPPDIDWKVQACTGADGGPAATFTDGIRCFGEVVVSSTAGLSPRLHLESLREQALVRYRKATFRMFEPVLYCGVTAHRYELSGRELEGERYVDERATALVEGDRMYVVRAWSSATAPSARRRCLDQAMAGFDPL